LGLDFQSYPDYSYNENSVRQIESVPLADAQMQISSPSQARLQYAE